MITITYRQYDEMLEKFKEMKTKPIWPTPEQMDIFKADPDRYIFFLCYLCEKSKPVTKAEKYSRQNMMNFISEHLEFIDDEDDSASEAKEQERQGD